jgi:hypothetical protein
MLSEGNAAYPFRCDSPLQIVMAVWGTFCLDSNNKNYETQKKVSFQISIFNVTAHKIFNDMFHCDVSYALYAVIFGTIKTMKHKKKFKFSN